jgi:pSer/pThr/pTyr-binding forkhead associated (FHA) protein
MDLFEKINRAFGGWYEGLFGGSDDVRPKDILRKILAALEEHRKEGFDNKVYVPNQYILEISVDDAEEKEYLLSFLDREELETAIRRYCQQNHYHIRGALDFTIKEIEADAEARRKEKVRVRCRYDSKLAAQKPEPALLSQPDAPAPPIAPGDDATVSRVNYGDEDEGTVPAVASASLTVHTPGKALSEVKLARGKLTIGRSSSAGNDLVLEGDGMVSRRHARIEMEADGSFTLYDLETTNGTRVNGKKVDNRTLRDGDEIVIGETRLTFHQAPREASDEADAEDAGGDAARTAPLPRSSSSSRLKPARLVLTDGSRDLDDFVLATVTIVGRAATNDIVLDDRSVGTRHARIVRGQPYTMEVLDEEHITLLNGSSVGPGAPLTIRSGDRVGIGTKTLRFEEREA